MSSSLNDGFVKAFYEFPIHVTNQQLKAQATPGNVITNAQ